MVSHEKYHRVSATKWCVIFVILTREPKYKESCTCHMTFFTDLLKLFCGMNFGWKCAERFAVSGFLFISPNMVHTARAKIPIFFFFFNYNVLMKECRIVCHFRFSKIVDFAKMGHMTTCTIPGDTIFSNF